MENPFIAVIIGAVLLLEGITVYRKKKFTLYGRGHSAHYSGIGARKLSIGMFCLGLEIIILSIIAFSKQTALFPLALFISLLVVVNLLYLLFMALKYDKNIKLHELFPLFFKRHD